MSGLDLRSFDAGISASRGSLLNQLFAFDKRWNLFDLLLIAAAPLLLYLINDSWTFVTPNSWVDPFLYTSYFLDLGENIRSYGFPYYVSRLPWILFGHGAYSLLPSEAANLFLRFSLIYGAVFSTYSIVWNTWRSRASATIAALLVCTNVAVLWSISWNYVDGPAIVLVLMSCACLTRAAKGTMWVPWSFVGGAFALMALSTNLILVIAAGLLGAWLAGLSWLNGHGSVRAIALRLGLMAAGVGIAFVVFGLVNVYLGGPFNYLDSQIQTARSARASDYSSPPLSEAGFLVFPLLAAVACLSLLARLAALRRMREGSSGLGLDIKQAALAAAVSLTMSGLWVSMQLLRDMRLLNFSYYANFMLPFAFVAIGGVIAVVEDRTSLLQTWRFPLTAGVLLVLLAPFLFAPLRVMNGCPAECLDSPTTIFATVALAVVLCVLLWDRSLAYAGGALMLFAILNVGVNDGRALQFDSRTRDFEHELARLRFDADAIVRSRDHENNTFFWYDDKDAFNAISAEVIAMSMWNERLISRDFPQHPPALIGARIRIPSANPAVSVLQKANLSLAANNEHAELEYEAVLRRDNLTYYLVFVRIAEGAQPALP